MQKKGCADGQWGTEQRNLPRSTDARFRKEWSFSKIMLVFFEIGILRPLGPHALQYHSPHWDKFLISHRSFLPNKDLQFKGDLALAQAALIEHIKIYTMQPYRDAVLTWARPNFLFMLLCWNLGTSFFQLFQLPLIKESLDEKLPSYEVLKMSEDRGVENSREENRGVENRRVENSKEENREVENSGEE